MSPSYTEQAMRNPDCEIRAYDPGADLEALLEIWFAASLRAHPFIGEERLREQRPVVETEYLPQALTWVACRAGEQVGFISLLDGFVGGLFVAPCHQGQGIGRRLVAHALALRGELQLEVYTENAGAVAFYRSLGFEELSRSPFDAEGYPFENARMRLTGQSSGALFRSGAPPRDTP